MMCQRSTNLAWLNFHCLFKPQVLWVSCVTFLISSACLLTWSSAIKLSCHINHCSCVIPFIRWKRCSILSARISFLQPSYIILCQLSGRHLKRKLANARRQKFSNFIEQKMIKKASKGTKETNASSANSNSKRQYLITTSFKARSECSPHTQFSLTFPKYITSTGGDRSYTLPLCVGQSWYSECGHLYTKNQSRLENRMNSKICRDDRGGWLGMRRSKVGGTLATNLETLKKKIEDCG